MLCVSSETWLDDFDNFTYNFPNYRRAHQKRSDHKSRGALVYLHNSLNFPTRSDLSLHSKVVESVTLEVLSQKT